MVICYFPHYFYIYDVEFFCKGEVFLLPHFLIYSIIFILFFEFTSFLAQIAWALPLEAPSGWFPVPFWYVLILFLAPSQFSGIAR